MRPLPMEDLLSAKRHVTVIVRLVVDGQGRLEHGEVVDAQARLQGRFVDWRGLARVVRACLTPQE